MLFSLDPIGSGIPPQLIIDHLGSPRHKHVHKLLVLCVYVYAYNYQLLSLNLRFNIYKLPVLIFMKLIFFLQLMKRLQQCLMKSRS